MEWNMKSFKYLLLNFTMRKLGNGMVNRWWMDKKVKD